MSCFVISNKAGFWVAALTTTVAFSQATVGNQPGFMVLDGLILLFLLVWSFLWSRAGIKGSIPIASPLVVATPLRVTPEKLDNKPWLKLAEECATLLDELDQHQDTQAPDAKEMATHVSLRLQEILERSGVTVIDGEPAFDPHRHKPQSGGNQPRGTPIMETLCPGLAVDRRVLRRALVRLASSDSGSA